MNKCSSHKKMYSSHDLAVEALRDARTRFEYRHNNGPVAVYRCDDCGYYHLTSQGKMNDVLEKDLSTGRIQRQKEAEFWTAKLKKR